MNHAAVQKDAPKHASSTRRTSRRQLDADRPAVAHCPALYDLQALSPNDARLHVHAYLHEVMPRAQADAYEALSYRWELHLVALDQLALLKMVDVTRAKLRRYRKVLAEGGGFPPLIGLGSDSLDATKGVLLCDGYHRALAMRDEGIHFAWMWLAMGSWTASTTTSVALAGSLA